MRVDGRVVTRAAKGQILAGHERVELAADLGRVVPEPAAPLPQLAAGRGWIGVDKPAGTAVHPHREGETGTLLNAAAAHYPQIQGVGSPWGEGGLRSGVVHRLDTDTSGAMLLATDDPTWRRLRDAFAHHRIRKTYAALVQGRPALRGDAEVWLKVTRHRPARVQQVPPATTGARPCTLSWRVVEQNDSISRLEIDLGTGFLHQIRATFAAMGHPVQGDRVYGLEPFDTPESRMALHAQRLQFEDILVEAPLPPQFLTALKRKN